VPVWSTRAARPCTATAGATTAREVALGLGGFPSRDSRRLRDATYLGMLFNRFANSPRAGSSSSCGQTAAVPRTYRAQVTRGVELECNRQPGGP
jgi:hypothetical protein